LKQERNAQHEKMRTILHRLSPRHRSNVYFRKKASRLLFSTDDKHALQSSSVNDPASTVGLRDKLLKAPYEKVNRPPLFPWRHSPEPLPRLDPASPEFDEKGLLLGGNIYTSHPLFDELGTAWMFMNVPWYKLLFFRHWQADLAENMSWAFIQGVAGILSNVYRGRFSVSCTRIGYSWHRDSTFGVF